MNQAEIVEAYWKEYELRRSANRPDRLRADDFFWAWEAVYEAGRDNPGKSLPLLVALADAAPDDAALAYLGAGPVEDLVNDHGERLIDAIESAAHEHLAFARTLSGINYRADTLSKKEVERRVRRLANPVARRVRQEKHGRRK